MNNGAQNISQIKAGAGVIDFIFLCMTPHAQVKVNFMVYKYGIWLELKQNSGEKRASILVLL